MSKGKHRPVRFAGKDWPNMAALARGLNVSPATIHRWIAQGLTEPPQKFLDRRAREAGEEAPVEEAPVAEEQVVIEEDEIEEASGLLSKMSDAGDKPKVTLDTPPWEEREKES